ncbi:hypothetical protein AMJ85_09990, partial [candidate division BRC1 bacterium SM23_51]
MSDTSPNDMASAEPTSRQREPAVRRAAVQGGKPLWPHTVLVVLAGLSVHLFYWFHRKPDNLVRWVHGGGLRPADWRSFARGGVGLVIGAVVFWLFLAWLAARKRRRPLGDMARVGTAVFALLLAFAPLSFMHYWMQLRDTGSFLAHTAVIVIFVLALVRAYDTNVWHLFDGSTPRRQPALWALIVGALLVLDLTSCSFVRFYKFATHVDDLGLYDQMCWGLIHGHGFLTTIYPLPNDSFLAEHIMPTVAVFAQLYRVWEDPRLLLLVQASALAGGGWLVYRIARKRTSTPYFPLVLTFSYFINPLLERGWINDFHVDALEVFFYLAAYACLLDKERVRARIGYWLLLVLLLGCKEDVGLSVAVFGLVVAVAHRRWAVGLATMALGLVWSAVAATQLLPHFASAGGGEFVANRQLANYAHLGESAREIALAPILHPMRVIRAMLLPDRLVSVLRVLAPVGFLAIVSPLWLLLLGPPYLTTILSGWEGQYNLHTHYGLVFVAPVYLAAIEGWRRLEARFAERPQRLQTIALVVVCLAVLSANEYRKFRLSRPLKWTHEYRT